MVGGGDGLVVVVETRRENGLGGEEVRCETITVSKPSRVRTMSNTQLTNNNPVYTFQVDMDANQFLHVLQQAAVHRETSVHLKIRNSVVSISTGNNLPVLMEKEFGCITLGIPDDMYCIFDLYLESLRPVYLNSFKDLVHFITIKMVDPRANTQLPPLLESQIKFDELAKIQFQYQVQVINAPSVRVSCHTMVALNSPRCLELTVDNHTFINIDSLSTARLTHHGNPQQDDDFEESFRLFSLLKKLVSVEKLSLSAGFLVFLEDMTTLDWPIFSHLRELELCTSETLDWNLLCSFLISSPTLELLALTKEIYGKHEPEDLKFVWEPPTDVPTCLKETLKHIDFESFRGRKDEIQLVGYLLNHSEVLETIQISTTPYPITDKLWQELVKLPIASPKCKVSLGR